MSDRNLDHGFLWQEDGAPPVWDGDGPFDDAALDDGGDLPPIEPPDEGPRREPGGPWRGHAPVGNDEAFLGYGATLAILFVWGGLFLAQFIAALAGARGGWPVVALSTSLFILFFIGPIVVGGWWLGRQMELGREETAWMRRPHASDGWVPSNPAPRATDDPPDAEPLG